MLLTSASSLVLLAGCDFTTMKNPFVTDRPPQVVDGERRQPIYNQQMISRMQQKTGTQLYGDSAHIPPPPMDPALAAQQQQQAWQQQQAIQMEAYQQQQAQAQAAAQARALATGKPVPPPQPVTPPPAMMAPPPPMQPPAMMPPPMQPPAAMADPMQQPMAAQPAYMPPPPPVQPAPMANPPASLAAAATAEQALPPAPDNTPSGGFFSNNETAKSDNLPPWKMREGVQDDYIDPKAEAVAEAAARARMAASQQQPGTMVDAPSAAPAPGWANKWIGKQAPEPDAPMNAERAASYPALSSVPPRPDEFDTAKKASQQTTQELQVENANANAARAALAVEPSQAYKPTPVEMPASPPEAKTTAKTESYVTPAYTAPAPEASAPAPVVNQQSYPGTPRRGIDIMTQSEWEALKNGQSYVTPAMPAAPDGNNAQPSSPDQSVPQSDQHSELKQQDAVPQLPVAGIVTQTAADAMHNAPIPEPSPLFARIFGTVNAEKPDAPAQAESIAPAEVATMPPSANATQAMTQATPPQKAPAPAQQPSSSADSSTSDWLLALITRNKEDEALLREANENAQTANARAAQYDASLTPEKQLLAQISGNGLVDAKVKPFPQQKTAPVQLSIDTPVTPVPALAEPDPVQPSLFTAKQETAPVAPAVVAAVEPPVQEEAPATQPGWMNKLFGNVRIEPATPTNTKAAFGTPLTTTASLMDPAPEKKTTPAPEPVQAAIVEPPVAPATTPALAEALPQKPSLVPENAIIHYNPQAKSQPQTLQLAAAEPEVPNRAIMEHNARMAAKNATKLAKKKGKADANIGLAKASLPAPAFVQAAAPQAPSQPIIAQDTSQTPAPVTIWQKAEQEKKDTLTRLPTAPDHLQAVLTDKTASENQLATEAADQRVAEASAVLPPPILDTDAEVAKPAWYNRMFNDNGKNADAQNGASQAVAVNDSTQSTNSANTAQNSASAGMSAAETSVNALSASADSGSKLPSMTAIAAPMAEVVAGAAAQAASSLPSPKLLQQIRTMPGAQLGTLQDIH